MKYVVEFRVTQIHKTKSNYTFMTNFNLLREPADELLSCRNERYPTFS